MLATCSIANAELMAMDSANFGKKYEMDAAPPILELAAGGDTSLSYDGYMKYNTTAEGVGSPFGNIP